MKYLVCPAQTEIVVTNTLGDVVQEHRELEGGKIVKEALTYKWWDFILTAAGEEPFYEKLTGIEAVEVGVTFRKVVMAARDNNASILALEDDLARRLKLAVTQRKMNRGVQHNLLDWMRLVDRMQDKDPTVALTQAQEN